MPPGPTFDPEAPPTKQTVTDSDGNPTCGSDKFHFMVFLEVAEDAMPTADKEFNELVTYGYISSMKGTIVASTEQAIYLASTPTPFRYSWGNPAPFVARTATPLPDELKAKGYLVLPNYLDKIDRGGCDTFLSWLSHKKTADDLRKKCASSGRQLLLNVEED